MQQSQNLFIFSAYTYACTSSCKIVVASKRLFDKIIIPFPLVEYEMIIVNSTLGSLLISYPTCTRGIIVKAMGGCGAVTATVQVLDSAWRLLHYLGKILLYSALSKLLDSS